MYSNRSYITSILWFIFVRQMSLAVTCWLLHRQTVLIRTDLTRTRTDLISNFQEHVIIITIGNLTPIATIQRRFNKLSSLNHNNYYKAEVTQSVIH